jgi:hypothetical protein
LSDLVKRLLEQVKSKILDKYCGIAITQYKLNKYTFIHVEIINVFEDRPVQTAGYINILIKRNKKSEKIAAYRVRIHRNKQLEYDIRKLLKTLKQQSKRVMKEIPTENSDDRREN